MEEVDKGRLVIRMGVSGWMFLLVLAHLGSPGQVFQADQKRIVSF